MDVDSGINSHPVLMEITRPGDIRVTFDDITYAKGSSLLQMFLLMMTQKPNQQSENNNVFIQGLTRYLEKFSYANVDEYDLYNELQETLNTVEGKFDVAHRFNQWLTQPNYPLVTVRKLNSTQYELTQSVFTSSINVSNSLPQKWDIPIQYVCSQSPYPSTGLTWFVGTEESFPLTFHSKQSFLKLNPSAQSFYRVNYDEETWKNLIDLVVSEND